MKHEYSWIFDADKAPTYFRAIKKPMNFGVIKKNLLGKKYLKF